MICKSCQNKNVDGSKFCEKCGARLVYEVISNNKVKENEVVATEPKRVTNKFNKTWVACLALVVGLVVVIFGYKTYSSNNVTKSMIKKDLIGDEIAIGFIPVEITRGNLKDVNIISQEIESSDSSVKSVIVKGTVAIKADNYTIQTPFEGNYIYSNNKDYMKLGWNGSVQIVTQENGMAIELRTKATEENLRKAMIGQTVEGVEVTEEIASNISISDITENNFGTGATASCYLNYKGKLIEKNISFTGDFRFNGENWTTNMVSNSSSRDLASTPSENMSAEEFKNEIAMIVERERIKLSNTAEGYGGDFNRNDIVDVKNISVVDEDKNGKKIRVIKAEIKVVCGEVTFGGELQYRVGEDEANKYSSTDDYKLLGNELSIPEFKKESTGDLLVGKTIDYFNNGYKEHKFTADDIKTLQVSELKKSGLGYEVIATMSYGEVVNDNITISVRYDLINKEYILGSVKREAEEDIYG